MKKNTSTLQHNMLHGLLGASEGDQAIYDSAESVFFKMIDLRRSPQDAELIALRWIKIYEFSRQTLPFAASLYEQQGVAVSGDILNDLTAFIRTRFEYSERRS